MRGWGRRRNKVEPPNSPMSQIYEGRPAGVCLSGDLMQRWGSFRAFAPVQPRSTRRPAGSSVANSTVPTVCRSSATRWSPDLVSGRAHLPPNARSAIILDMKGESGLQVGACALSNLYAGSQRLETTGSHCVKHSAACLTCLSCSADPPVVLMCW